MYRSPVEQFWDFKTLPPVRREDQNPPPGSKGRPKPSPRFEGKTKFASLNFCPERKIEAFEPRAAFVEVPKLLYRRPIHPFLGLFFVRSIAVVAR